MFKVISIPFIHRGGMLVANLQIHSYGTANKTKKRMKKVTVLYKSDIALSKIDFLWCVTSWTTVKSEKMQGILTFG
jgi:hypothetical protein